MKPIKDTIYKKLVVNEVAYQRMEQIIVINDVINEVMNNELIWKVGNYIQSNFQSKIYFNLIKE